MRIDLAHVRRHVDALKAAYPELAEDGLLLADMVEGETEVFEVLSHLVRQSNETKAISGGLGEYCRQLTARKARLERRVEALRALILSIMEAAGLPKAQLPEATIYVRAGVRRPVISEPADLADEFVRTERLPNMEAIKAALAEGRDVAGAHLSNGEPSLAVLLR